MGVLARKVALIVTAIVAALLVYVLSPVDLGEPGRRAAAICVLAGILWCSEVVPLFATSLLVVVLEIVLLAGQNGVGGKPIGYSEFIGTWGSSTIILFLGGFLLSVAAGKHGLDAAIASCLLKPFMKHPIRLVTAVTFTGGFMGMWISNTVTAAMMLGMVAPMLRDPRIDGRLAGAIALACAFGPSLGSFATPIATPPNAVTVALLRAQGMDVSFLRWMLFGVPLSLVMLALACFIICAATRPTHDCALEPI